MLEALGAIKMSRISIDVTPEEHQKLKALAALQGKSIKDFVIESTIGAAGETPHAAALAELETILDERASRAAAGGVSRRSVKEIFKATYEKSKDR